MNYTQHQLLEFLQKEGNWHYTMRGLQEIHGISSVSVVHHHLKQLFKKGYLVEYQQFKKYPNEERNLLNILDELQRVSQKLTVIANKLKGENNEKI